MLYKFDCIECDTLFESIVKIGTEKTKCLVCGSDCERNHTPDLPNFQLLGGCWERTRYETVEQHHKINKAKIARGEKI